MKRFVGVGIGVVSLAIAAVAREQSHSELAVSPAASVSTQPGTTQPAVERPLYAGKRLDEWTSYQAMHAYFLQRFVESRGFGLERMVAFNDPRFRRVYADGRRYTVGNVQLLSLNDGKVPFAYVTGIDADKQRIRHAAHATLQRPEIDALSKLKEGMKVVLTGDEGHREMVGAIRATVGCTKCHGVAEGTLLGAFRYPLQPQPAAQRARQSNLQSP